MRFEAQCPSKHHNNDGMHRMILMYKINLQKIQILHLLIRIRMNCCVPADSWKMLMCSCLKGVQRCFLWFVVLDVRTAHFIQFFAVYFTHRSSNSARGKPHRLVVFYKRKLSAAIGRLWLGVFHNGLSSTWVTAHIIQFQADCLFTFSNGFWALPSFHSVADWQGC